MPADPPIDARVLVVDDDESNRESLSRRLRRRGLTVDLAVDGTDALARIDTAAANSTPFDLILLDVMMPGLSGIEVLERLRKSHSPSDLPIIMATANDRSEDIAQALALGANDYVTKPIDFPVALARVNTQLDMSMAVRQVLRLQRDLSLRNAELENAVAALRRSAEQTNRDLELAARVQATFLPRPAAADPRYAAAWRYLPCDRLAGDALNICRLGLDHVAFYVLDVTGHGVASSLTAVTAARMLAPADDPATILVGLAGPLPPAAVMTELSARFPFDTETGQFLTCVYALLDLRSGRLDYASAGHPDPILFPAGGPPFQLRGTGLPIGLGEIYEQQTVNLAAGDEVWLYSDGVTEAAAPDGTLFGVDRLTSALAAIRSEDQPAAIDLLLQSLVKWSGRETFRDDVSVIALRRA